MVLFTLIKLVKSLSGPEKRYFKLCSVKQGGEKDYLGLFDIIDKSNTASPELIQTRFKKSYPKSSINNTSRYLVKVITDSLIESKTEKDIFFRLLQEMMRVKILQERSLAEDAYMLLKKIRKSASSSQQYLIEYFTYREELNYLGDNNFQDINDKTVIGLQMKSKDILKILNHIQDHYSLFELLKYRLVHSGKISSDDEKRRLNDLMLSEMTLVAGKSKNSFASQKLHLLFQSFFFTDIGDYQSALKTFRSLNQLFEQNLGLLDSPPLDYLSTLNGILESLHSLKKYEDINFYINKIKLLDKTSYPEYFRYQAKKTIAVYQLAILTGEGNFKEGMEYVSGLEKNLLTLYNMVDEEKQWELYFYCSLSYFGTGNWKKAHDYINEITQRHKIQPQLLICKAVRLLNIIIYYEKGDTSYLEYEVRSYKRFFRKIHPLMRSETLLLKFILMWPDVKRKKIPDLLQSQFTKEISVFLADKYERQLLKYFDFSLWLMEKFTGNRAAL